METTSTVFTAAGEENAVVAGRRPLPATMTVREARDTYLAENGFSTSAYDAETFDVEAFGRTYTFTNTPDRKWAIPLHDLHHVATGYGTDLVGEAEVGAFELMGGCKTPVVYALDIVAVIIGLFVAPIRTLRAFADARNARALFRTPHDYEELLAMPLGELREKLGLPRGGVARAPRRLHDEQEMKRPDALPGAPPQPLAVALPGAIYGVTTLGLVVFELVRGRSLEGVSLGGGPARWMDIAVAVLAVLLVASAPALRRGSLGGRAVFGHAAAGLVTLFVASFVAFDMAPAVAAIAVAAPLVLLCALARQEIREGRSSRTSRARPCWRMPGGCSPASHARSSTTWGRRRGLRGCCGRPSPWRCCPTPSSCCTCSPRRFRRPESP